MTAIKTKSAQSLSTMKAVLLSALGLTIILIIWQFRLFITLYFSDSKTVLLNGIIVALFVTGIFSIIKAFKHYTFEEEQVAQFNNFKTAQTENAPYTISHQSLIGHRYRTIKSLFERKIPINHGAITAIMTAEESLFQSLPKFINNVLILTGVFGTIVSLTLALVGASSVLENALPGKGVSVMVSGMNTALTTSATAIVCFFLYTYFYQRFTDVQTYVFAKIEETVLFHIIPEFAFDAETVNHETKELMREVNTVLRRMKEDSGNVRAMLEALHHHNTEYLQRLQLLIHNQTLQRQRTELVVDKLDTVKEVLCNGFRLEHTD